MAVRKLRERERVLLEPWIADIERLARLGLTDTAAEITIGVIAGLRPCEPIPDSTVLGRAPDAPCELARDTVRRATAAGVAVEVEVLGEVAPDWFH